MAHAPVSDTPGAEAEARFLGTVIDFAHCGNPDWHAVTMLLLDYMRPSDIDEARAELLRQNEA